ncbi:hypothetical protein [Agrococcus carbonis]|uniref:hypothetical protein n=1 Tax=Agrococcus carbonis TaxID=684552 RepID=UPI0012F78D88|nr:hypothetical protein [Agrococcus carbonis]
MLLSACITPPQAPAPEPTAQSVPTTPMPATPAPAATPDPTDETEAAPAPTAGERGVLGRASVDVPEGWEEQRGSDAFALRYFSGDGATDPQLSLADGFGSFHGARAAVSVLIAQAQTQLEGFTIHSQEDVEVPGSASAVRVDFSYGTPDDVDGVFDGMWITAVDRTDGHTIALAFSGGADEVDDAQLDAAADSFEMLPATP